MAARLIEHTRAAPGVPGSPAKYQAFVEVAADGTETVIRGTLLRPATPDVPATEGKVVLEMDEDTAVLLRRLLGHHLTGPIYRTRAKLDDVWRALEVPTLKILGTTRTAPLPTGPHQTIHITQ